MNVLVSNVRSWSFINKRYQYVGCQAHFLHKGHSVVLTSYPGFVC